MINDDLSEPRPSHGLQAMMRRWEQLHPVNAVQIAWLNRTVGIDAVCAAADRVFGRLTRRRSGPAAHLPPALDPRDHGPAGFEFQHRPFVGDWRTMLEGAVTTELNRPYDDGVPPWRVFLFESPGCGQFLALGYRHVIADARSVALVLHEIVRQTVTPSDEPAGFEAEPRPESVKDLYPEEFRWRRIPSLPWNPLRELWASRRAFRPPCDDPRDLRMEFRIHGDVALSGLKAASRRHDATINDLLFAAILEWLARRYPLQRRGRRPDLAVAALADLTGRSANALPRAFGQYLSQFAVRLQVAPGMPFDEIVRQAARCSQAAKRIGPLIDGARGFDVLAKLWDRIPLLRRPDFLPALIPLLAGVSNVHLGAVVNDGRTASAMSSYFRGTCVTNLVPMMLCLTTVGDSCTLTTTHRPTVFTSADMTALAAHLHERLDPARHAAVPAAA
ncbi:MAG: hypothetical protein ACM3U2_21360 [Deltaproteobacteria bacterium]